MTLENGEPILFLIEALEALAAWPCAVGLGTAVTGAVSVNRGNVVLEVFSCLSITLVDTECDQNSPMRRFLGLVYGYRRNKGRREQSQAHSAGGTTAVHGHIRQPPASLALAQSLLLLATQFTFSQVLPM